MKLKRKTNSVPTSGGDQRGNLDRITVEAEEHLIAAGLNILTRHLLVLRDGHLLQFLNGQVLTLGDRHSGDDVLARLLSELGLDASVNVVVRLDADDEYRERNDLRDQTGPEQPMADDLCFFVALIDIKEKRYDRGGEQKSSHCECRSGHRYLEPEWCRERPATFIRDKQPRTVNEFRKH